MEASVLKAVVDRPAAGPRPFVGMGAEVGGAAARKDQADGSGRFFVVAV